MDVKNIRYNEDAFMKLEKRKKILLEGKGHFSGYPSIDMPWLKYYTEEQILAPIPNMSAYDYLRILNNNNLNMPAIEFLGQQITYLELFKKINDTTKSLHAIGVKPGDIVTIVLPACPEETFLFYAIDQIGACANFIFAGTSIEEIEKNLEELDSKFIFIFDKIYHQTSKLKRKKGIQCIQIGWSNNKDYNTDTISWEEFKNKGKGIQFPITKRNPNSPLFIAKTGGTTGKPKRVLLSDNCFNQQVHQLLNSPLNYNAGDTWVRVWPMFSASSAVASCHLPLCYGMKTIIEPAIDIDKLDELILNYKPSHMVMISSCIDSLLKSDKIKGKDLSFIKTMGIGGEQVTAEFEDKAANFLIEHNINSVMNYAYGMTENSSCATSRFSKETSASGSVGVPQINTIVAIFDPKTGKELKYGEEGEICILSSNQMLGYYNEPQLTNSILRLHKDGNTWLHSGDLGYMDEEGRLYVKGRMKRMIMLYNGNKVYPLDIEELLESIEEIDRAIVVPEPDLFHEGAVVPCVFITTTISTTLDVIKRKIEENIGKETIEAIGLKNIYIKKQLPQTSIGKIDIQELEKETRILAKKIK